MIATKKKPPGIVARTLALALSLVGSVAILSAVSCRPATEIRPGDVRTYTRPKAESAQAPAAKPASAAATPAAAPGPAIEYDLPPGWTDQGASGMRLATLRPGSSADAGEITIIPASGTLEGNAARWQEQLTPGGGADRVARSIADAEKVPVNGVEATILLLLDEGQDDPQAILAAMIPLEPSSSLFIKFKGPAAVARSLREPFTDFVRSIRWK